MLLFGKTLIHKPIMSLQTGREIAKTEVPIINPADLRIVGFTLRGRQIQDTTRFLLTQDIRELSDMGLIVDSADELLREEDAITLQKIRDIQFELLGIKVIDTQKKMLGKVIDYSFEPSSFIVQQLQVKASLMRDIKMSTFLIHRTQIVEINNTTIIVKSATIDEKSPTSPQNVFINPFRKSETPDVASNDKVSV